MTHIESSLVVRQPVKDVFAFLNAPDSHARFIPNMSGFQKSSQGEFGSIGAEARGLLSYFGLLRIPVHYEIIEHETDRRLAMKGQMGPISFRDGYILQEAQAGTNIRFWLELRPTGWAKMLSPLAGLIGKIHAWETLRNLKRELAKLEGAPLP
jgi:hypothetical protein